MTACRNGLLNRAPRKGDWGATPQPSAMKRCIACRKYKAPSQFYTRTSGGKVYLASFCKRCDARRVRNPEYIKRKYKRHGEWAKRTRLLNQLQDKWIWTDSRKSDKIHGRENTMTRDFIRQLIKKGCSYCGEKTLRMTLDRIDNARGHTNDNVVAACVRCNDIRGNMPHSAWLCLCHGLRRARRQGLFADWKGRSSARR